MTSKNKHKESKQNNKNWNNTSNGSINPEAESPRRRPQSAKHDDFESAKSMLYSTFTQHPEECLCKQCICGRHLCKFNSPSPSMTFATTYGRHYPPRNPYRHHHNGPHRPLTGRTIDNPLLTCSSTYRDHYNELDGDGLERPKPNDLLKCKGGPAQELTSYSNEYPGHRGKNQYVPMNPQPSRGGLAFNSSSTYSKQYSNLKGNSAPKARPPDQFSMTGSWFGGSSYRQQYQNPQKHVSSAKKENNTSKRSVESKSQKSMDISNNKNPSMHFQTTYKNDYIKNNSSICPAAKTSDKSNLEKSHFKENTHFKGMDSRYVSLAKHSSYK